MSLTRFSANEGCYLGSRTAGARLISYVGRAHLTGLLLLACASTYGCRSEVAEDTFDSPVAEATSPDVDATDTEAAEVQDNRPRPFLPISMQRSTRAETFPHEAHVEISCAVCHDRVEGHASHGTLECAQCHRSSALAVQDQVTPEQCLACHHSPLQEALCADCHEATEALTPTVSIRFVVWEAPKTRELPFEHEVHRVRNCDACHTATPSLAPEPGCSSCHEDHHRAEARCMSCHEPPAEQAHDLESHLGCGGGGCHEDPLVEQLASERATCLVCHQEYEEHEPGRECSECHQVRAAGGRSP